MQSLKAFGASMVEDRKLLEDKQLIFVNSYKKNKALRNNNENVYRRQSGLTML